MSRCSLAVTAAVVVLRGIPVLAQTPAPPATTVAGQSLGAAQPQAQRQAPAGNWIFSQGFYTNDPKTGKRVDQYQKLAPVYRVPNDQYFGPEGPHPFGPDFGYPSYYPVYLPYLHPFPYHLPYLYPHPSHLPFMPPALGP